MPGFLTRRDASMISRELPCWQSEPEDLMEKARRIAEEKERKFILTGWKCPDCGSIYAPVVKGCTRCNKPIFPLGGF